MMPLHVRGLTIVELMVALAVGSIIVLLSSALLVSTSAGLAMHAEAGALDDSGRFAVEAITRAVRQAAFINWDADGSATERWSDASASVAGLDARTLGRASEGIEHAGIDAVNGSDVLALRYAGAGPAPNGDGSVLNCAGFGVPASGSEAERGWSIFYVGRAADGEAELRCKYRSRGGWGADAIVRGVDSFQVLYGVDLDESPDGIPNTYLTASAIDLLDASLTLTGANALERARELNRKTYWKRVASVRVALLLHGASITRASDAPEVYDLFGHVYSAIHSLHDRGTRVNESEMPPELKGRSRHLFGATIVLRNPSL